MKKSNQLTKHYCEAYMDAALIGAKSHCKFLSSQPEFSETYFHKKRGHIIEYIALAGNHKLLGESFKNSPDSSFKNPSNVTGLSFLELIVDAAKSGDLKSVKIVLDNLDRFEDKDTRNYKYNIDCALRYAGELGHLDVFNHLLTIGANPRQWHVIRWTADKGPKNTYERLLQVNKLPLSTKRRDLINICESEAKKLNYEFIDLSKF